MTKFSSVFIHLMQVLKKKKLPLPWVSMQGGFIGYYCVEIKQFKKKKKELKMVKIRLSDLKM